MTEEMTVIEKMKVRVEFLRDGSMKSFMEHAADRKTADELDLWIERLEKEERDG